MSSSARKSSLILVCRLSLLAIWLTPRKRWWLPEKGSISVAILIGKNTRVMTQGITGKTGQFHTRMCQHYANGAQCFVAGVNPKKAGEKFEGIPVFATVREA